MPLGDPDHSVFQRQIHVLYATESNVIYCILSHMAKKLLIVTLILNTNKFIAQFRIILSLNQNESTLKIIGNSNIPSHAYSQIHLKICLPFDMCT